MIDGELLKKISSLEILTKRRVNSVFAGEYHSAFKGRGIEFEEVRPYAPGDDIRDIDWNVSARTDELFVKRFREERELTLYILVDLSWSGVFGTGPKSKRDQAAEIAALLGFSALKNHDKVGLIAFTDHIELFIPPGKGKTHVMGLLQQVLNLKPQGRGTSIEGALDYLGKVQKKQAIVVLLSDFYDQGYQKKMAATALKHDLLCLNLYDPGEEALPKAGILQLRDPETGRVRRINSGSKTQRNKWKGLAIQRRENLAKEQRRLGADFGQLNVGGDWMSQLSSILQKRQARRFH